MAVYELPDLPYAFDALEPHISAEIMELHHDKHHATYVAGANAALEALEEERNGEANPDRIRALSKNLAFNLGGHTNHSIFWKNLSPNGGGQPEGELYPEMARGAIADLAGVSADQVSSSAPSSRGTVRDWVAASVTLTL